jgi:hypothetical protein
MKYAHPPVSDDQKGLNYDSNDGSIDDIKREGLDGCNPHQHRKRILKSTYPGRVAEVQRIACKRLGGYHFDSSETYRHV